MLTNYHPETGEKSEDYYLVEPIAQKSDIEALHELAGSEWFASECENANYHSLHSFLRELIDSAELEQKLYFEEGVEPIEIY